MSNVPASTAPVSDASGPEVASAAKLPSRHDHGHLDHIVQFYLDDGSLISALTQFIGSALHEGEPAIVIATAAHRDALMARLEAQGIEVATAIEEGRYVALDAADTLEEITIDGWPNATLFTHVIGGLLKRAEKTLRSKHSRVAAFGEMVALLWTRGQIDAAIRLEELWNELASQRSFNLRCGYSIAQVCGAQHDETFLKVCAEHSGVIAGESCMSFMKDDERLRITAQLRKKVEALEAGTAHRLHQERLRFFIESVQDYAIFTLDRDGGVTGWNTGAERIKGYKAQEIIGRNFSCFYTEEDIQSRKPQRLLDLAAADGRAEDEGWRVRKNGSRFWANVIITASRDEAGHLCGFTKITRDITEKKQAHEALRKINDELRTEIAEKITVQRKMIESERSLRELSRHLLRMQDEERQRLGRELHDSVGQYLAVLKMGLDSLKCDFPGESDAHQAKVDECIELADQAIKEVRTISYLLYPPMLEEMGLRTAIPWYLDGFSKRSGIQVDLDIPLDPVRLPRDMELAMFRVLQESLTNVHRHSGSTTAHVRVWLEDGTARLEVKDDGKGIPEDVLNSNNGPRSALGVGLRGMHERLRQLGGTLELYSKGGGTTVRAIVPCAELKTLRPRP